MKKLAITMLGRVADAGAFLVGRRRLRHLVAVVTLPAVRAILALALVVGVRAVVRGLLRGAVRGVGSGGLAGKARHREQDRAGRRRACCCRHRERETGEQKR